MSLKENMENRARPVILYEMIPPKVGAVEELEKNLDSIRGLVGKVDGINIPEIHEETRRGARRARLPERMEPRVFAQAIQKSMEMESVINRVTVHEPLAAQHRWMKETASDYVIRNLILVGGESHKTQYPGPSVTEAASLAAKERLGFLLGGITIPSRTREAQRIRQKYKHGLRFLTTQVLLDPNDIVDLIQGLNGLDVRILLSFTPISRARDIEFLQWLGVDVPKNFSWSMAQNADPWKTAGESVTQATKLLTDIFDNLPSHPPALGINVEQITSRNFKPSLRMLAKLTGYYQRLLRAHSSPSGKSWQTASLPYHLAERSTIQ